MVLMWRSNREVYKGDMIHKLQHLIGWYYGEVYTWYDNGILMVGFKCGICGDITGVHKSKVGNG